MEEFVWFACPFATAIMTNFENIQKNTGWFMISLQPPPTAAKMYIQIWLIGFCVALNLEKNILLGFWRIISYDTP